MELDDNLERLYKYVLEKQPCEPAPFKPCEIHELHEVKDFRDLRCKIVNILKHFRKDLLQELDGQKPFLEKKLFDVEKREFIDLFNLNVIGQGSFGKVFTFAEKCHDPFAIGKYSASSHVDPSSNGTLLKEIIIGLLLNTIHDEAPNFMYTFGGFLCGLKDNIESLCQEDEKMKCVGMFEYVNIQLYDNMSLDTFEFDQRPLKVQVCTMLQIFHSLHVAYNKFGFTHNDLHLGNIHIRTFRKPVVVKLGSYSIETYVIPVILDYGLSEVYFTDENGNTYSVGLKRNPFSQLINFLRRLPRFYLPRINIINYIYKLISSLEGIDFTFDKKFNIIIDQLKALYENPNQNFLEEKMTNLKQEIENYQTDYHVSKVRRV